jgi:hypothetical protein
MVTAYYIDYENSRSDYKKKDLESMKQAKDFLDTKFQKEEIFPIGIVEKELCMVIKHNDFTDEEDVNRAERITESFGQWCGEFRIIVK